MDHEVQAACRRGGDLAATAIVGPMTSSGRRRARPGCAQVVRLQVERTWAHASARPESAFCGHSLARSNESACVTARYPPSDRIIYALSAPLFIWSGQVDPIPLQHALAGLLLTVAAGDHRGSTSEGSLMTATDPLHHELQAPHQPSRLSVHI